MSKARVVQGHMETTNGGKIMTDAYAVVMGNQIMIRDRTKSEAEELARFLNSF